MKKISLVFKIGLAFFLFGFALWCQQWWYNLTLAALLAGLIRWEKLRLFRFPRQGYFFAFFLLLMFLTQAFAGYGKVLLTLPFGLVLTDSGLSSALTFVTQVLLIFLLFGAAIYSAEREEIRYYFRRMAGGGKGENRRIARLIRIGMYVFYLLPGSLDYRQAVSGKMRDSLDGAAISLRGRLGLVLEHIYRFIYQLLIRSESDYTAFRAQDSRESSEPPSWLNLRHLALAVAVLAVHAGLVWAG